MQTVGRKIKTVIANLESTGVEVVVINGLDDMTPAEAIDYFNALELQENLFNYAFQDNDNSVLLIWNANN